MKEMGESGSGFQEVRMKIQSPGIPAWISITVSRGPAGGHCFWIALLHRRDKSNTKQTLTRELPFEY